MLISRQHMGINPERAAEGDPRLPITHVQARGHLPFGSLLWCQARSWWTYMTYFFQKKMTDLFLCVFFWKTYFPRRVLKITPQNGFAYRAKP